MIVQTKQDNQHKPAPYAALVAQLDRANAELEQARKDVEWALRRIERVQDTVDAVSYELRSRDATHKAAGAARGHKQRVRHLVEAALAAESNNRHAALNGNGTH
jgi:hypothetical protein